MTKQINKNTFSFKLFFISFVFALVIVASVRLVSGFILPEVIQHTNQDILNSVSTETQTSPKKLDFTLLENARSSQEQQQGLQFRESFCDTCGMLFTFTDERERVFWMPNVAFSIDMIFIDSNGKVVTIQARAKPNQIEEKYYSKPAMYVLEVPADYAQKNEIYEGDIIDMEHLNSQLVNFVWV